MSQNNGVVVEEVVVKGKKQQAAKLTIEERFQKYKNDAQMTHSHFQAIADFMSNVMEDENGCWVWTAPPVMNNGTETCQWKTGYALGYSRMAHIASFQIHKSFHIHEDVSVKRTCDNTCCVNPEHLKGYRVEYRRVLTEI